MCKKADYTGYNPLFSRLGKPGLPGNVVDRRLYMSKSFAEIAMEVIREDWEFRKSQKNPNFNQERIAKLMGISRSQLARALGTDKNPTISFICAYATAVGRPIDDLLNTIGVREMDELRLTMISAHLGKQEMAEFA